jgi:3-oxoacyl-[acyl-carrier protein] reductase
MRIDLSNQIALVTGAGGGIGHAAARALADNGAKVVISDIDAAAAQAAAADIPGSLAIRMDVSSEREVAECIDRLKKELGRLDILINNAGVNTKYRVTVDQFPIEEWDRIIGVDLRGVFLVSRAASALMVAQRSGRIINIASVAGLVPLRLQCAYTTAKSGVVNLTRTMAIELAAMGLTVNCVAPGSTLTGMTEPVFYSKAGSMAEQAQRLIDHIPAGRIATSEEVAHAILFFCAPQSAYITGQVLCVDGGWTAGGYLRDF